MLGFFFFFRSRISLCVESTVGSAGELQGFCLVWDGLGTLSVSVRQRAIERDSDSAVVHFVGCR